MACYISRLVLSPPRIGPVNWPGATSTEETVAQLKAQRSAMPTGVQAAAAYLRELLLRPGRYRRKWEQYAERGGTGR